jgi:LuxR family maltose regulon positive regulatory protein
MTTPFLTTKLYVPPPQPNLVARPHLVERLEQGLHLGHKLALVSAPAGYGKTALLSAWWAAPPNQGRDRAWLVDSRVWVPAALDMEDA